MKRVIILLTVGVLLLTSAAAFGLDEKENMCKVTADLASSFMGLRQSGVPMAVALKNIREAGAVGIKNTVVKDAVKDVFVKMLIEIYRMPRFEAKSSQELAIQQCWETWFIRCMDASAGDN